MTQTVPGIQLPPEAHALIAQDAWMSYRLSQRPLHLNGGYISRTARLESGEQGLKMSVDPGNWMIKTAIVSGGQKHGVYSPGHRGEENFLLVNGTAATFKVMGKMTSGKHPIIYSVIEDDALPTALEQDGARPSLPSPYFSIGGNAQNYEPMPVGETHIRLSRLNWRRFLQAVVVEQLAQAGYKAGHYTLTLALAVRNEELFIDTSSLEPRLTEALEPWVNTLYGSFRLVRVDSDGNDATYTVCIQEIVPYAQTLGSFYSWYYGLNGEPVQQLLQQEISRVLLFDLGGGDTQVLDVVCGPDREPGTQGRRICPGTREIAQLLATYVKDTPELRLVGELNIAAAQQALISRRVQMGGAQHDVSALVEAAVQEKGGSLVSRIFSEYQEGDALYLITGAGSILLEQQLHAYLGSVGRTNWKNYLLFPPQIAGEMNAIGGQAILSAIYS